MTQAMERLSTGKRVNSAADDAAGLGIATKLKAQVNSLNAASRNATDALALIGTIDGALEESSEILLRMRELAVQSASDTNTGTDRSFIQDEINQDEFVAAYWLCDIEGSNNLEEVYSAQATRMKYVSGGGNRISSRIIVPRQGIPSLLSETDFVMLYVSPSLQQWGSNVDNYQNNLEGIGDDNAANGIFSCSNSTVYVGRTIR